MAVQRAIVVVIVGVLGMSSAVPAAAQSPDEKAVRAVVERYQQAREQRDAAALTALFVADADQLVSSGEWRRGRDAVVEGSLGSSRRAEGKRTLTVESIRLVAADVAIADSRYEIAQTTGPLRRMWASWVLVKTGGEWKITAIRNMLPAAPVGR